VGSSGLFDSGKLGDHRGSEGGEGDRKSSKISQK
jgi:hypothetical protein